MFNDLIKKYPKSSIVTIPLKFSNFWDTLDSYYNFYLILKLEMAAKYEYFAM